MKIPENLFPYIEFDYDFEKNETMILAPFLPDELKHEFESFKKLRKRIEIENPLAEF